MPGLYVYGFMRSGEAPRKGNGGVGDPAGEVVAIAHDGVAALATPVPDARVPPRRANLLAHSEVLRGALDRGPVVPLRFGTVMPDTDAVRAEIDVRRGRLHELLDALEGRCEMTVSAQYRSEAVLREVLAESPAIAAMRRQVASRDAAAGHFARIRLGELVAEAVAARRAADATAIAAELDPLAVAVVHGSPLTDWGVLNTAYLVERARLEAFDAAVERAGRARAERMTFKLIGPLPAHSFVGVA